jgi:hypothetical protein
MLLPDVGSEVTITGQAHRGEDLQILRYDSRELDKLEPLIYRAPVSLNKGDPVILYSGEDQIIGHVSKVKSAFDGLAHFVTRDTVCRCGL